MTLSFAYLRERDIDIVLVEEIAVNPAFAGWLCLHAGLAAAPVRTLSVQHSLNNKYDGETDIQAVFDSGGSARAVLIENKITAAPMPDQAARYKVRGEQGKKRGDWTGFVTCLIAPREYLDATPERALFDSVLAYEDIAAFFEASDDPRSRFRAAMVREAIAQNRRGLTSAPDKAVTTFVADYTAWVGEHHPELGVEPARPRPAGSHWVRFRPRDYPKHAHLMHQFRQGKAKLFFAGSKERLVEIQSALKPHLEADMEIGWTAASSTVEIDVGRLRPQTEAVSQRLAEIAVAMAALGRLDRLYRRALAHELEAATGQAFGDVGGERDGDREGEGASEEPGEGFSDGEADG